MIVILYGHIDTNSTKGEEHKKLLYAAEEQANELLGYLNQLEKKAIKVFVSRIDEIQPTLIAVDYIEAIQYIFNCVLGNCGYNGQIVTEVEKISRKVIGCPSRTQRICSNKQLTKQMLSLNTVPVMPDKIRYSGTMEIEGDNKLVSKPLYGARSDSVKVLDKTNTYVGEALDTNTHYLVEEFVEGSDITVLCMSEEAIYPVIIETEKNIYDHAAKYDGKSTMRMIGNGLGQKRLISVLKEVDMQSKKIVHLLQLKSPIRIDGRLTDKGEFVFLEVNTQLRLTHDSTAGRAWKVHNPDKPFYAFIEEILETQKTEPKAAFQ